MMKFTSTLSGKKEVVYMSIKLNGEIILKNLAANETYRLKCYVIRPALFEKKNQTRTTTTTIYTT